MGWVVAWQSGVWGFITELGKAVYFDALGNYIVSFSPKYETQ